jgi:adenylate cyclase
VMVQVVDVPTRRTVATKEAASTLDGLLDLEEDLVGAIASALGIDTAATHWKPSRVIEAQKCYARACLLRDRLAKGSLEQARYLLERAVQIDPQYSDALAALASTYALGAIATANFEDIQHALVFANRALTINPRHARARMWQGYAFFRCELWTEAICAYRHAIELDPTNSQAYYFCGAGLMFSGRCDEALGFAQRAVQLDSGNGLWWLALGSCHLRLGHLEEASYSFIRARSLEAADAQHPSAGAAAYLGEVLRLQGRLEEGREQALAGIETAERSDHAYRDAFRAHALLVLGRIALDANNPAAASAAFGQVLAQMQGRSRTLSCGHFVVQALAGLARANRETAAFDEARRLFDARAVYNFEPFFGATDDLTLTELALGAESVYRLNDASVLRSRADASTTAELARRGRRR